MILPNIVDIQKFSLHDGDGIRTTVFFKGCNLECAWCHNPESKSFEKEPMIDIEKCTGCGSCITKCKENAIKNNGDKSETNRDACIACGDCSDFCINNLREIVGTNYEIKDLMKEINQDRGIYESSGGGVTLSGGEVMLQDMEYIEELCRRIKHEEYNLAVDTCGFAPQENYARILPYVDTFLYDIKTINDEIHQKYMGQSNELILSNLEFISKNGAAIRIRIPIVEGVNADDKSIQDIIDFIINKTTARKVNILPYHNTGSSKYEKLGLTYTLNKDAIPTKERMEEIKELFIKNGIIDVKIGG